MFFYKACETLRVIKLLKENPFTHVTVRLREQVYDFKGPKASIKQYDRRKINCS